MKKRVFGAIGLVTALAVLAGCGAANPKPSYESPEIDGATVEKVTYENEVAILLSDEEILVDGVSASQNEDSAVHIANDIIYYEDRDTYDSGNPYGEGTEADKHSAQEAEAHTVVHITQPGIYRLSGTLSRGQIAVDLGDEAKRDPDAVVTLVLDGVDITCTVAPAVIFYQVYECDTDWVAYDEGEAEEYTPNATRDTTAAGANVIVADGSVNNISGSYVARIYKDKEGEKKLHKYDGAFYSKMSMNVNGEAASSGILNIAAANEGLNSEVHLTLNGGRVNIQSGNDGINTNEDNVSVTTINGGALHIVAGLGEEGDGVDSNGYLVINGGVVIAIAKPQADSGLDSDLGSFVNGGWVLATGAAMDWAESDSDQVTMNLQFSQACGADEAIVVTDRQGNVVFAYDPDQDETTGEHNRAYQGAILSCPNFAVGESYYVYVGGSVTGEEENGLYDPATVTGFEGVVRQQYTGSDLGMMGPGGMGGGFRPDMSGQQPPEGMEPGQRPQGEEPPEGWDPDRMPEPPEGMEPGQRPEGQNPPGEWQGGMPNEQMASVEFFLTDKVNAFSGISDETT